MKYLGVLHNYDRKHKTDYENILRLYLNNNCSVQAVSAKTYTHRNTINYRIKKIKEILHSDLDNSEENFNYMDSICSSFSWNLNNSGICHKKTK